MTFEDTYNVYEISADGTHNYIGIVTAETEAIAVAQAKQKYGACLHLEEA